jgi:hypothetical protein
MSHFCFISHLSAGPVEAIPRKRVEVRSAPINADLILIVFMVRPTCHARFIKANKNLDLCRSKANVELMKMLISSLAITIFAAGCSTTGTIQYVPIPDTAPVASATSPNAKVFVIRPSKFYAGAVPMTVSATGSNLQNTRVGVLTNGGFLCFEQSPGELTLRFVTHPPGGFMAGPSDADSVTATVATGEVYYFGIAWEPTENPFRKNPRILRMNPIVGKSYLRKAKPPSAPSEE